MIRHSERTDHSSPAQVHREIQRTREEMDHTLDQLGERLNPRHLLDDLIDMFSSSGEGESRSQQLTRTYREIGGTAAHWIRENPIPALLCGAGAAYWIYDQFAEDEGDWHEVELTLDESEVALDQWAQESPAWSDQYQWGPEETEERWTVRADQTFDELRRSLSETGTTPHQKLKLVAGKVVSLSGHEQQDIHARWANLREHSGSFVDARTGEPYDESYGKEWENLAISDVVASADVDDEADTEHATGTVEKLKAALSSTGVSAKEMARRTAAALGDYGRATGKSLKAGKSAAGGKTAQWGRAGRERMSEFGHAGQRQARKLGRRARARAERTRQRAREGAAQAQERLNRGYVATRDTVTEAIEEYPLAIGAACLGLGLLGGLLIPRSRREDEWMGEASDELKSQARSTGKEVYERGKHVAEATAAAAMDEAERQGISPHQIGERAKETASQAREKMHESTQSGESAVADIGDRVAAVAHKAAETAKQESQGAAAKQEGPGRQGQP